MVQQAAGFGGWWRFDVTDPASVAAERAAILAETNRLEAARRVLDAERVLLEARAYRFGHLLDVTDGQAGRGMHVRSLAGEVSVELDVRHGQVLRQFAGAWGAVTEFPVAVDALAEARISERHLDAIVSSGVKVTHDDPVEQTRLRALFVELALREVAERVLSDAALKRVTERIAEELTQAPLAERRARERGRAFVSVTDLGDGFGVLHVGGSLLLVNAVRDRVRKQATQVMKTRAKAEREAADASGQGQNTTGVRGAVSGANAIACVDDRSLGEVSVDLVLDQLLTGTPSLAPATGGIQASVSLVIPATTLLADQHTPGKTPALLDGQAPVPLDEAKRIAALAPMFTRILTHPVTGTVTAVDTYKPTTAMRRYLEARDQHCRFPGCRLSASACQTDHTTAWEHGGTTTLSNLAHLCVFHHTMKHATPWSVRQLDDGALEWTTPSGKTLIDKPERQGVTFVPSRERPHRTQQTDERDQGGTLSPHTRTRTRTKPERERNPRPGPTTDVWWSPPESGDEAPPF